VRTHEMSGESYHRRIGIVNTNDLAIVLNLTPYRLGTIVPCMEEPPAKQPKLPRERPSPLRQLCAHVWSWSVITWLVSIGLAVWGVLLGMSEFDVANWFFIGSTLLLLTKILTWSAGKRPVATRNLYIVGAVVICSLVLLIEVTWVKQQEAKVLLATEAAKSPSPPAPASASPAIMFNYDPMKYLPISVGPHSTALIFQLHPKITDGFFIQSNHGDKPIDWPNDKGQKAWLKNNLEQMSEYTLSNYGDKSVLNVALTLDVQFLEAKKHDLTKRYRKPDGQYSVEFPGPPPGGSSTDKYISGEMLSSHKHPLVIPVIEPKIPVRFYIVNQTKHFAKVFLPSHAMLRVAGESEDRKVKLNRQELNIVDKLAYLILPPSGISWIGLPDSSSPSPKKDVKKAGI